MDLQAKAAEIFGQMEALNQLAIDESRDFTSEEQAQYDKLEADAGSVQKQIERAAKINASKQAVNIPNQTIASRQEIFHAPADPAAKEFEAKPQ